MSGQRRLLLVLLVLSAALHVFRLSEPRSVVFDEVHFGGFIDAYCGSGRYFFDIHPPHAKLIIAGAAALGGYRGGQNFETLGAPVTEVSPALLRSVPMLIGCFLPLILFTLLLQLGASPAGAFLGGLAVLLDNALIVQTRVIALDGLLLASIFGSVSSFLAAMHSNDRGRRTLFALLAGLLAGLAAGTKFTGLSALVLIGTILAVDFLRGPSWTRLRVAASCSVWVLSGAVLVYSVGWVFHFLLLTEPGPGYAFVRPVGDLLADTVRVHRSMLASNYGLTATHPYSSPWWSWPLMVRPVFYWSAAQSMIYLVGNPIVWWGTTLALIVVVVNLVLVKITNLEVADSSRAWPPLLWVPLAGYFIALLPLIPVPRPLFLYHYFTPLLFGLCAVVLWLDHVGWTRTGDWRSQRLSVHVVTGALVLGFLSMSPFTYSFVTVPFYQQWIFEVFPGWR